MKTKGRYGKIDLVRKLFIIICPLPNENQGEALAEFIGIVFGKQKAIKK